VILGSIDVPLKGLVSKEFAKKLRKKISRDKAGEYKFNNPWPFEPECTTALELLIKQETWYV
jgi:hypothetical protein